MEHEREHKRQHDDGQDALGLTLDSVAIGGYGKHPLAQNAAQIARENARLFCVRLLAIGRVFPGGASI